MQYTLSTLPAVAAAVGDVMDALESGGGDGGDGVGAGPAFNAKISLHAHNDVSRAPMINILYIQQVHVKHEMVCNRF